MFNHYFLCALLFLCGSNSLSFCFLSFPTVKFIGIAWGSRVSQQAGRFKDYGYKKGELLLALKNHNGFTLNV